MRLLKSLAVVSCLCFLSLAFLLAQVPQTRVLLWDQVKGNEQMIVKAINELMSQNDQLRGQLMAFLDLPVSSTPGSAFNYIGCKYLGGTFDWLFKGNRQTATMFENFNYGGKQIMAEVGASVADLDDQMQSKGMNDKVSSLKVDFGGELILYEDKNFKGKSKSFVQDTPNLGDFNDKMSSYKMVGRVLTGKMAWTAVRDRFEKEIKQHLNAK